MRSASGRAGGRQAVVLLGMEVRVKELCLVEGLLVDDWYVHVGGLEEWDYRGGSFCHQDRACKMDVS